MRFTKKTVKDLREYIESLKSQGQDYLEGNDKVVGNLMLEISEDLEKILEPRRM